MGIYLFQPIAGGIVNTIAYNQIPNNHEQLQRLFKGTVLRQAQAHGTGRAQVQEQGKFRRI